MAPTAVHLHFYKSNIKKLTTHLWILFIHPFMDFSKQFCYAGVKLWLFLFLWWLKSPQRLPQPNFLYDMHLQGIMVVVFIKHEYRSSPRWLRVWTKACPLKTPCFRTYSHNIYCNNSKCCWWTGYLFWWIQPPWFPAFCENTERIGHLESYFQYQSN